MIHQDRFRISINGAKINQNDWDSIFNKKNKAIKPRLPGKHNKRVNVLEGRLIHNHDVKEK